MQQRRSHPEATPQELQAIRKVEDCGFDPHEGFEWPFSTEKMVGEVVVVR